MADTKKLQLLQSIATKEQVGELSKEIADLSTYVTPEMFGAKGDDASDDTAAIQQAIDSGMPCVLSGKYRIYNTITLSDNAIFTINGMLRIMCEVGILLNGSNIVVNGNGYITTTSKLDNLVCIRRLVEGMTSNNRIFVNQIRTGKQYNYTAIEITGGSEYAGACYDIITSSIRGFRNGIVSRESENQNSSSWYTALTVDSTIENCVQAITFDWHGNGSTIRGQIQPLLTSSGITDAADLPLVTLAAHTYLDAFIWDMGAAVNKYAIHINGKNCIVNTSLSPSYISIPHTAYPVLVNRPQQRQKGVATVTTRTIGEFDNTNDILLNVLDNPEVITSGTGLGKLKVLLTGKANKNYFTASSGEDVTHTIEFEFATKRAIRSIAVIGEALPSAVAFYISKDGTEYINVLSQEIDVDYHTTNGTDTPIVWNYDYARDNGVLGDFAVKHAKKLKISITLKAGTSCSLVRLCAFTGDADVMKQSGGRFGGDVSFETGKGIVLADSAGGKHRLVVGTDGTLTTEAVE